MNQLGRRICALVLGLACFPAFDAFGQISVGSTGVDGALNVTSGTVTIDLGSNGFYDQLNWAIVFNYTTVNIASGATVKFINHWSNAPVVWLCSGPVMIDGTVDVSGGGGIGQAYASPGPGGFRGGLGWTIGQKNGAGFGFGGAFVGNMGGGGGYGETGENAGNSGGGAGGKTYGSPFNFPLIGGSGGAGALWNGGGNVESSGGAGGGAILIASDLSISVSGSIRALGGGPGGGSNPEFAGGGSGGAIRLLGNSVTLGASSNVTAAGHKVASQYGGDGGNGRIRIEANGSGSIQLLKNPIGVLSTSETPGTPFPPVLPKVWVDSIDVSGQNYVTGGIDPKAVLSVPGSADVQIPSGAGPATLNIRATDVPVDAQGNGPSVIIRVTLSRGQAVEYTTTPLVGTLAQSSVSHSVNLSSGVTAIQLRVVMP